MSPPEWVVGRGVRLTLDEFGSEFRRCWARLERRFLKVECWQEYQEPESESLRAFLAGNLERAMTITRQEAEADRPLYEDVAARALEYARIRLVSLPLTPYLQWEWINYAIRAAMGERILVVRHYASSPLPDEERFDYLLFDRGPALAHDYGDDGLQVGGWLVQDPRALRRLEAIALDLRDRATPFAAFQPAADE